LPEEGRRGGPLSSQSIERAAEELQGPLRLRKKPRGGKFNHGGWSCSRGSEGRPPFRTCVKGKRSLGWGSLKNPEESHRVIFWGKVRAQPRGGWQNGGDKGVCWPSETKCIRRKIKAEKTARQNRAVKAKVPWGFSPYPGIRGLFRKGGRELFSSKKGIPCLIFHSLSKE